MTPTQQAPTAGQAAAALPRAHALGVFTPQQCMDDRIRDAHARAVIQPIPFPANPWRAADGGGGEHDQSIPPGRGVDQHQRLGGVCTDGHSTEGVSK